MNEIKGCSFLGSEESAQLCDYLSSQISALKTSPLLVVLFSFLSAIIVSLIAWQSNKRSQQAERHNKSQREALLDMQNAALKLRYFWRLQRDQRIINGDPETANFSKETKLIGEFQTKLIRIERDHVRDEYNFWFAYAQELFHNSEDLQEFIEEEKWTRALECSGNNLRSLDK